LKACAECGAALAGFAQIDGELIGWGRGLGLQNPPPSNAREQLAAKLGSLSAPRRAIRWAPAAALAAAVALAVIVPRKNPPAVNREPASFIQILDKPPRGPHEISTVVRMNIRVGMLISVGYRVTADPDTIVPADVLVGEDGRAHAVRVRSDIDLNGTGD
jgi:hypothetical protein